MIRSPIQLPRFGGASPRFGGYYEVSRDQGQRLVHSTYLFREPQLMRALPSYLARRFPQGAPIYSYACSNGSEPYSLALMLREQLGDRAARFPITGRDIGEAPLAEARAGRICLEEGRDIAAYRQLIHTQPFEHYFERLPEAADPRNPVYTVKPALRSQVHFEYGDILADAARPESFPQPSVVLFRNAWYLLREGAEHGEPVHRRLARNLFHNLKPGSLVLIGETDAGSYNNQRPQETTVIRALLDVGFRRAYAQGLYPLAFERT